MSRTQVEFTDADLERIALTYHRWRGTQFSDGKPYENTIAFSYSASLDEVHKHGYLLTPGRYVGSEQTDESQDSFAERMEKLTEELAELMANGMELDQQIRTSLSDLGYAV